MSLPETVTEQRILDALPDGVLVLRDEAVVWSNAAAQALLGCDPKGRRLDELLLPGEERRLRRLLEPRPDGVRTPQVLRVRLAPPPGGEIRSADVGVSTARVDRETVLTLRSASEASRAEALMADLARLASEGQAAMDLDTLLESAVPVFEALGWRAALFDVGESSVRVSRVLAFEGSPLPVYALARGFEAGPPILLSELPLISEVLEEGRPLFLDDLSERLRGGPRVDVELAEAADLSGLSRGAWIPIRRDDAVGWVLVVLGADLGEHDFVALQLFAAQIAATDRLQRLSAAVVRRERARAVGEMAAVMAHEVRNPLGVIFNVVSALRRAAGFDASTVGVLDRIEAEADRLKRVVSELLELARPVVPELRRVDLAGSIRDAVGGAAAIEVRPAGARPTVLADPLLLRRALTLLVANAREHGHGAGQAVFEIDAEEPRVVLRVCNEGSIPPEAVGRVFEPFFTTKPQGTGLGLAIVRRIVEDLGGEVGLEGGEGRVCFALRLPAAKEEVIGR